MKPKHDPSKIITLTNRRTNKILVSDDRLIHREIYNSNKFAVIFHRREKVDGINVLYYLGTFAIEAGPVLYRLPPQEFWLMPHGLYWGEIEGAPGEPFNVIEKFGDAIGDGDKLPSRPEPKRK